MTTFIMVVHIFVGIALILIVLLQTGRGTDIGAAFGGSSQTLFGSAGPASFLGKLTALCAFVFILTSLSLTYVTTRKHNETIFSESEAAVEPPAATPPSEPATPEAPTP
ncbi:MAG: preprotein translocase subunit SecG [Deltaproteobacteria bacterium]|nr:preprotein translocase subunit SecG [Deltaproteobacteria bacterium]